jgi:hypothetical protein
MALLTFLGHKKTAGRRSPPWLLDRLKVTLLYYSYRMRANELPADQGCTGYRKSALPGWKPENIES